MVASSITPLPLSLTLGTDRWQQAPETLLVAGVRDVNSLGWVTARNWLEEVPEGKVVATYRSDQAQNFLKQQADLYTGRVVGTRVDWALDDSGETLAGELNKINKAWISMFGHRLNIAGVAHCVAQADSSSFIKKATELSPQIYLKAFKVGAVSLIELVGAAKPYLSPNSGIITYGYGDPEKTEVGYGAAMQLTKSALTKAVMVLAEELGHQAEGTPEVVAQARTAEIITGYIPTRSGRGVAILQRIKPGEAEARSSEAALLAGMSGASQAEYAGRTAVLFMRDPAFQHTTGARFEINGGASVRSSSQIS